MIFRQIVVIMAISVAFGIVSNIVSPNKIPFFGHYRSLSSGDGPIVPPTAEEGDPPFIAIDVAEMEFSNYDAVFVDARDPEEFECGTIPGSINIPFEYMPDEGLEAYIDSALGDLPREHQLIVFCSGEECDLSLHLGRNLMMLGYTNVAVFFGGSREWEKFGLEMERQVRCDE
ncbi:MAG: rhodanese-like domain-containing protein [Candidatus Zixiibacteriota bacterium]|nr:MAG: rhodanese-like domain-containing protein [candidate division Zixibacteria bacterium]